MNAKILLKGTAANQWFSKETFYFTGYFFADSILYRGLGAIEFIQNALSDSTLQDICKEMNGIFAFLIEGEDLKIVSDPINFFPVFYSQWDNKIVVSDCWEEVLKSRESFAINEGAITEYQTAGFVLSDETLDENIKKTNAGQVLTLSDKESSVTQYDSFITDCFSDKDYDSLKLQCETVLMETGKRLIQFLDGRTAVVPLSGGYDSRLIVALLRKMNYHNVICFTYGKPNPEVPISKTVAESLGYNWHFVDFTKINIQKIQSGRHYKDYLDFAANGFAMPYLMEYFAMAELEEQKAIPSDAVFLPGHSGDFLGGSYIKKTVTNDLDIDHLPDLIESKYFIFTKKKRYQKQHLRNRIAQSLLPIVQSYIHEGYNMSVEEWDIREKLSKFIFHSSQVFNYYGYEVYFPLWDQELKAFFRTVPFLFRENKKLYDDVLDEAFFRPLGISFSGKELKASALQVSMQKMKDAVRYLFPWSLVLKRVNNADWPHYQLLTHNMMRIIEENQGKSFKHFKTYNAVICEWYLEYIKEKYK